MEKTKYIIELKSPTGKNWFNDSGETYPSLEIVRQSAKWYRESHPKWGVRIVKVVFSVVEEVPMLTGTT